MADVVENTRVFVSGLPPTFTDDDLRKHFASRHEVTDAHVLPKRRIGFVGFKTHANAQDAVNYFNKTFCRMSRIAVELARPVGAEPPKHASKERGKNLPLQQQQQTSSSPKKRTREDGSENDPKLQEYLAAMQPAKSRKTWADDCWQSTTATNAAQQSVLSQGDGHAKEDALTYNQKKKLKRSDDDNVKVTASHETAEPPQHSHLTEGEKLDERIVDKPLSAEEQPTDDMDWLRSRTSRLLGLMDEEEENEAIARVKPKVQTYDSDEENEPFEGTKAQGNISDTAAPSVSDGEEEKAKETEQGKIEVEHDANIDQIQRTGRLFVRNLSYKIKEEELHSLFSPFGKIDEIHIAFDTRFEKSKGFAYVQYFEAEHAIAAYKALDGQDFQGRLLHILPATSKKTYKLDDYELSKLPLKKQQQIKRKQEAQSQTFSWNALYMNADAVMASVAERLGVSKSTLLDPTSSDAAVKQAHAETHVIQETKAYFTQNGVNLDSFKQRERGNTAILVKNFSFGVKAEDLRNYFEPFGQIKRLLMPPSGTIAIVEFALPDEAQRAFKGLAYRKIGDSILFLEKAPKDLFDGKVAVTAPVNPVSGTSVGQGFSTADTFAAEENEVPTDTATLYIRNLNFSTTTAGLADVFRPFDGFLSATVKTKRDPKKPGQVLSMGFGFVEFRTSAQAQRAMTSMNGYKLDNHDLVIKASHRGMDAAETRRKEDALKKKAARATKIIIKNLPFEATKKDIYTLFGAYGKLRSVRLPKKFDRTARGFAFADFISAREAETAMDALRNTHLLGRRLVLEFAASEATDAEEEIAKMEKKVSAQVDRVQMSQLVGGGRKKFQMKGINEDDGME
ncbi:Multiple RNA-binding domain-containing protein 1 [Ascosphaera aggregata]|nr:Multiple RNA-binding domain-containing protein 1 [Ascosphaera aggregata]